MTISVYALTAAQLQQVGKIEVQRGTAKPEVLSPEANFLDAALKLAVDKECKVYAVLRDPAAPVDSETGKKPADERVLLAIVRPPITTYDQLYLQWLRADDVQRDALHKGWLQLSGLLKRVAGDLFARKTTPSQ